MSGELKSTKRQLKNGILNMLFFWDVIPTLRLAQKKILQPEDIHHLHLNDRCAMLHQTFSNFLNGENFKMALAQTFLCQIIITFVLITLKGLISISIPILIKNILDYIEDEDRSVNDGIRLVILITLVRIVKIFLVHHSKLQIEQLAQNASTVISMELCKKSQRISLQSNTQYSQGEIINLLQVDATKLETVGEEFSQVASFPIQIGLGLYLLFDYIGISFIGGLAVIFLAFVINLFLGKLYSNYQELMMISKDQRTKDTSEVFSQIKFVKINSLELFFKQRLNELRNTELVFLNKKLIIMSIQIFCFWLIPQLLQNVTFGIYIQLGNKLTTSVAFTTISLFAMINDPIISLPECVQALIEASISLTRCANFIYTEELDKSNPKIIDVDSQFAIEFKNTNLMWNKQIQEDENLKTEKIELLNTSNNKLILSDLNISIKKGEMVIIVGDVASGKTSLFQSILNEMIVVKQSQIRIKGSIAYVSQKSWIQNGTVKDNILFGYEYDPEKYQRALRYSCLEDDIKILMNQDQTMIGEKGINLSGGQKARLAIARALYSDRDIYLFDDPISAVDAKVASFLMEECMFKFLKGKTILLITHSLQYCKNADQIIWLEAGSVKFNGTYKELQSNTDLNELLKNFQATKNCDDAIKAKWISHEIILETQAPEQETVEDQLMLEEDREEGEINSEVIEAFKAANGGTASFLFIAVIQVIQSSLVAFSPIWLGIWSEQTGDVDNVFYLEIYFIVGCVYALFAAFRNYVICRQNIRTSKQIHSQMIEVIHAHQCQFFERVPQARLMNRFTKDLDEIDNKFYQDLSQTYVNITIIMLDVALLIYAASWIMIFPLLVYFFLAYHLQRYYMKAIRELQRLRGITKSPILSIFSESLVGMTTIRAFNKTDQFTQQFAESWDINRKICLSLYRTKAWFNLYLGLLSCIINISSLIYCVFYNYDNASKAAILLVQNASFDDDLAQLVNSLSVVEKSMVAFERCLHLNTIAHEKSNLNLIETWPTEGAIEYKNYSVKYRENLPNALNNLNIKIDRNLKTGIVGRTGAGKSTITMTLLRLLEASEGSIIIDGVDISTLNLIQLRESITMIMQDATIFRGTLRDNLDPKNIIPDVEIIEICNKCCLSNILQRNGLNSELQENGANLSAGERQLICICRAVLKKSKIVLIDEATANIDIQTEQLIQETIMKVFVDCTVITIAHRINTILHCDKIIVIDKGQIMEHGFTNDLLEDKQSLFYSICQEAQQISQ